MEKLNSVPLGEWPANDRAGWEAAFTPRRGLFGKCGSGVDMSPRTAKNYRAANGIWLRYLAASNQLDHDLSPASRVTPEHLDGWVEMMRRAGRKDSTISQYLISLHSALRLIDPSGNTAFILKPGGVSLSRLFPSEPKPFIPLDTKDLMRHVRALHAAARQSGDATKLRDAALMALLLLRAPRVSSVAAMQVGQHLRPLPDGNFECQFPKNDVKGRRRGLFWPLDPECSAMMYDYLSRARPLLKNAASTGALWLGDHGEPLDDAGLAKIFRRLTQEWCGTPMGPHTARKWLRSTAARRSPEAAFDAAEVMGHSARVSLRHYAEAREIGAAQRYAQTIRDLRRQTASIAERFFADRENI